ncbi:MAG TPA: homocitrate synthase, partial [Chloroflexi bacterium]|nr:homocitrate synthase [Chloroflexota bacterium]
HKLTGWNALQDRASQLGIHIDSDSLKEVTLHIKAMADHKRITLSDVDEILHQWADNNNSSISSMKMN